MTQQVGALNDRFLGRDRPLGESRVLWEIGPDGCDVRVLRERLDLDSGYLSRLLRSLETGGLVRVTTSASDARVRNVSLTARGRRERALLDQRSDEFAVSVLAPLSTAQRDRLVAAMADVERLLTASMVDVAPIDPSHPHAAFCLRSYYAELDRRFTTGFDPDSSLAVLEDEIRPPAGVMLVATLHSEPVGCGCLKFHGRAPTEIKRLWVADAVRGLGIGRRLLRELEQRAAQSESRVVRLDTNAALVEAIAMYRSNGYSEIPAFNDEPYANHWFEKQL